MKSILMIKRLLFMALLLGTTAFGFGVTQLSAQTTDNVSWKLPAEALASLNQDIALIDTDLKNNPNQSLEYKRKFYYAIASEIEAGRQVNVALNQSYAIFVPATAPMAAPVEPIPNPVPVSTWKTYYQDAATLLQN